MAFRTICAMLWSVPDGTSERGQQLLPVCRSWLISSAVGIWQANLCCKNLPSKLCSRISCFITSVSTTQTATQTCYVRGGNQYCSVTQFNLITGPVQRWMPLSYCSGTFNCLHRVRIDNEGFQQNPKDPCGRLTRCHVHFYILYLCTCLFLNISYAKLQLRKKPREATDIKTWF